MTLFLHDVLSWDFPYGFLPTTHVGFFMILCLLHRFAKTFFWFMPSLIHCSACAPLVVEPHQDYAGISALPAAAPTLRPAKNAGSQGRHPVRAPAAAAEFFQRADCFLRRNFYSSLVQQSFLDEQPERRHLAVEH